MTIIALTLSVTILTALLPSSVRWSFFIVASIGWIGSVHFTIDTFLLEALISLDTFVDFLSLTVNVLVISLVVDVVQRIAIGSVLLSVGSDIIRCGICSYFWYLHIVVTAVRAGASEFAVRVTAILGVEKRNRLSI